MMDENFNEGGYRVKYKDLYKTEIRKLRKEWKDFLKNIGPCPSTLQGKGIVMCAGGIGYFTCCWVAIHMIRRSGCQLPIEVWYVGNELSEEIKTAITPLQVTCIDVNDYPGVPSPGYSLKPFAIINSSFKEVLYLDADNVSVRNPEELFVSKEYQQTGAVFWPDFWKTTKENPIWAIIGSNDFDMKEQESGQVLINKEKCWSALNLCMFFNARHEVYHKLLLGDKDTFKFAWMACKTPFHMIQTDVAILGYEDEHMGEFIGTTMVQHNTRGEISFLHRNLLKWDITKPGEYVWQKIKRFRQDAVTKEYHVNHTMAMGHAYLHIKGDIEETDFKELLGNLEQVCMEYLDALRKDEVYARYMVSQHIEKFRPFY